jgi:uncharacterized protein (DUF2252 family)
MAGGCRLLGHLADRIRLLEIGIFMKVWLEGPSVALHHRLEHFRGCYHAPHAKMPTNQAERVVEGAKHLSPHLGKRMRAVTLLGKSVVVRELLPQDLKIEVEELTRDEAMKVAQFLSAVVGKAHSRQMDTATRKRWQKDLQKNRSTSLDAPTWLWTSVVDLLADHERAYLDHCRKYAMEDAA